MGNEFDSVGISVDGQLCCVDRNSCGLIRFVSLTEHLINEFSAFKEIGKPILHCPKWNLPIEYWEILPSIQISTFPLFHSFLTSLIKFATNN